MYRLKILRWFLPCAGLIFLVWQVIQAGVTVPPPGIRENNPNVQALLHARLVIQPGQIIEDGTLVIRDGNIVAVGKNIQPPADATLWDLSGKTIYAGFVDPYSNYGMPSGGAKPSGPPQEGERPRPAPPITGSPYWNPNVTPQKSAAEMFGFDSSAAEKLRSQGITAVLTFPPGNIISGTGALVNTGTGLPNDLLAKKDLILHIGFNSGGFGDDYPGSLMGVIALIRQSFLDAEWYELAQKAWEKDKILPRPEQNQALAKLAELKALRLPMLMDAKDDQAVLREVILAREFGLTPLIFGSNYEYRRLEEIAGLKVPIILPLNFPETPAVKTPEEALQVNLDQLRFWYFAPENSARLHKAGVKFAFSSFGLKDVGSFIENWRKTTERGLDKNIALSAITITPAQMLGVADRYGSLSIGKAANLVIADGDLFDKKTKILETWVEGKRYEIKPQPYAEVRGSWDLELSGRQAPNDTITLEIKGEPASPSGNIIKGKKAKLENLQYSQDRLSFTFTGDSLGWAGVVQMSAIISADGMLGNGTWPEGIGFTWKALRTKAFTPEPDTTKLEVFKPLDLARFYPESEFGYKEEPRAEKLIAYTNATLWTCGPGGIIKNGTLLVGEGKIIAVGDKLALPKGAKIVNAAGKHITPGIIDCHSHIAVDGDVNEGGQTITAEVRIGDVIDATDIDIYRQLAGGVTSSHILHGSANAIGGQNQVIKLRWGGTPEELKFSEAPPTIKFALGENPKQSNWGDRYTVRYPQTRMGVEEIIRDDFQAAGEYEKRWKEYNKTKKGIPPRKDLELEAMAEILNGKRLVHSHSYRQDEILMLVRLAEEYGIKIAAFQHVLEGYMVADALAQHGAGGSCFSDWWAYKFEVYDAIPYNGALMHDQGVVVSFNSDSNEMARRLNTEAAKAMKYGGISAEEALKFVTINPAIQLRVDRWVGSLEPGKDADFVVWSGDPLSTYSICLETWIEGKKYFDREEDAKMREEIQRQRALLIQKALSEGGGESKGGKPGGEKPKYSCHGIEGEVN